MNGPATPAGTRRPDAVGRQVTVLTCAAQFVLISDFSVVNVALPTIERYLRMPSAERQRIVTG